MRRKKEIEGRLREMAASRDAFYKSPAGKNLYENGYRAGYLAALKWVLQK